MTNASIAQQNPRGIGTAADPYEYFFFADGKKTTLTRWQEILEPPAVLGNETTTHYLIEQFDEILVQDENGDNLSRWERYDSFSSDNTSVPQRVLSGNIALDLRQIMGSVKNGVYCEDTDSYTVHSSSASSMNAGNGTLTGSSKDLKTIVFFDGNSQSLVLCDIYFDFDYDYAVGDSGEWHLLLFGEDYGHSESDICESFMGDLCEDVFVNFNDVQRLHGTELGLVFSWQYIDNYLFLMDNFPAPLSVYLAAWDDDFFRSFAPKE